MEQMNPNDIAQRQIDIVAQYLDLDEGVLEKLKQTRREVIIHFPVEMDDGSFRVFTGYRVFEHASSHCQKVFSELLKDLHLEECQLDELWSFVKKRKKPYALREDPYSLL